MEDFYLKEEQPQEIIEVYKGLILEEPGNARLHLFLGKLYLRLEMRDDATERFEKAQELGLESPYLSNLLGEVAYRTGNFEEAASRFKEAMGLKRRILIPFICTSCGDESNDWHGTCPECGEWDKLQIAVATRADTV
jgi:tetratricopeptide (TPR) repeat protein